MNMQDISEDPPNTPKLPTNEHHPQLARFEKHLYNYLTARDYTAPNPHSDFE